MNPFLYVALGLFLAAFMDWLRIRSARREAARRIEAASEFLKRYGMEAHTYLAAFGRDDGELRTALQAIEGTGNVVIDKDGRMVGRLLPKIAPEHGLSLVVDNTKSLRKAS